MKVMIPVTSLCPCSKEISQYGAHNQRSHVTVSLTSDAEVGIEEVIDYVETQASCQLYYLLKRPDEKYVTEKYTKTRNSWKIWCAMSLLR